MVSLSRLGRGIFREGDGGVVDEVINLIGANYAGANSNDARRRSIRSVKQIDKKKKKH